MRRLALLTVCWFTLASAALAQAPSGDAALDARVQALAAQLRCLVCQNQSLADSHADLAIDLKNQVREQLQRGASDADVFRFMAERYGDFVLYNPPLKATTLLLWFGPALLLAAGLIALFVRLRRRAAAPADTALTPEERTRAAALLEDPGNDGNEDKPAAPR